MIKILLKKYKKIGWDVGKWKNKRKKFKIKMGYDLNKLMILNWTLGRLNKKGNKSWSFYILMQVLLLLKKIWKKVPSEFLSIILRKMKQNVLLFNKRRGSLIFELPRFLTIEQSINKIIEWWIKIAIKNKENIIKSLMKEIRNIFVKKGEVLKKKAYIWDTLAKNKPFFYILKKKKKKRL